MPSLKAGRFLIGAFSSKQGSRSQRALLLPLSLSMQNLVVTEDLSSAAHPPAFTSIPISFISNKFTEEHSKAN